MVRGKVETVPRCVLRAMDLAFFLIYSLSLQQLFITRDIGSDFDMDVYNKMITEVQSNPKFAEYFVPSQ